MLTAFQKKVASAAVTCLSICVIVGFAVLILKFLGLFLHVFGTVVWPLAAALILSFMLSPLVRFIAKRLNISAGLACGVVCVAFIALTAAAAVFALPRMADEVSRLAASVPDAFNHAAADISEKYPSAKDISAKAVAEVRRVLAEKFSADYAIAILKRAANAAAVATGGAFAIFSAIAAFAVVPIYLYYMLTSNFNFFARLDDNLKFLAPQIREDTVFFVRRFSEIMASFFRGQLLVAFIMGVLIGSGMWLAGVKFGFLLGFCAGLINVVPYLGTIIGLGAILPVAVFQDGGGWTLAALAFGVFVLVQIFEGYVITPRIMGGRTGLHPTVIIFSVFFWGIALNGILGMILAIPLTAFIFAAWERILARLSAR